MKTLLQVLNILTLFFTIGVNYFFNGRQGLPSISTISNKYENLLTPSGYAFGIWALVYIGLIIFAIYQLGDLFKKELKRPFVLQIGWWFIIANLANAAWVWAFTSDYQSLSLFIMFILFFSLLKIVINTNMERWDAPNPVIFYIWWPFSLYFGWINVALIVNISTYLTAIGWDGSPLNAEIWAILILLIAGAIFITMTWTRNMREYATVGVWGIVAIAIKNWDAHPVVAIIGIIVAITICINAMRHGYLNREFSPFTRKTKAL